MFTNHGYRFRSRITAVLAACPLAVAASGALADRGWVEEMAAFPSPGANAAVLHAAGLEKAFWVCDYFATTRGVDSTPVEFCGTVYEELKAVKFGGDFEQLHQWWQERKVAEHERLVTEGY